MGTEVYKIFEHVLPFFEPYDALAENMEMHAEMTRDQTGFLCGLLRDHKPRKILELGVAAGGTTAAILKCIESLSLDSRMYSVDLNERLYYENDKQTGYVAMGVLDNSEKKPNHQFMLGGYLPECLDEIGAGIDFAIIDTVHSLPGELLDFAALVPFLEDKAVVVLHDVTLSHNNSQHDSRCYATQILFSTVTADKYLNNESEYPNIAAFIADKKTRSHIADVFSAMTLNWTYLPEDEELSIYRNWYKKYYPAEINAIFEQAIEMNTYSLGKLDMIAEQYIESLRESIFRRYDHVLLYGAGKRGQSFMNAICNMGEADDLKKDKIEFVVSQYSALKGLDQSVLLFDSIPYSFDETLIVLTTAATQVRERLSHSEWHWLDVPDEIWASLERVY